MDGIILTPLKKIYHPKGDIFHAMKESDIGFSGFGEAYFSTINKGETKGWKKHIKMTLNIIVPFGSIQFVVYDEANTQSLKIVLSNENYQRLTIKPGRWFCFTGLDESNLLLNIASCEHDPDESIKVNLNTFSYK